MLLKNVLQKCTPILLVSTLLITQMERVSIALTITPDQPGATELYEPVAPYAFFSSGRAQRGETTIRSVEHISPGGTRLTNLTLRTWSLLFGGRRWRFKKANRELEGNFEIVTNKACGYTVSQCGNASPRVDNLNNGVGSVFQVKYHPQLV